MKLKYERFDGLACLYVRGPIDAEQLKMLNLGLRTLIRDLEETIIINLTQAELDPASIQQLVQTKKALATKTQQKIQWVHKDRTLADFTNLDLLLSRMGTKFRQIGDRIKADDTLYGIAEQLKALDLKEKELGGTDQNTHKMILENKIMKEQVRILKECIKWQEHRMSNQVAVPTSDDELPQRTAGLVADLKKAMNLEVDL